MSLEERVSTVQKELESLEARLKEQVDYKRQCEELKAELLRLPTEAHVKQVEDDMALLKEAMEELRSDSRAKVEEITRLGKVVNDYQQSMTESALAIGDLQKKLSEATASRQGFKDFLLPVVKELIEGEKLVTELMKPQTQSYTSTKTVADLTLEVVRQPLALDMKTTRGQVLALITDGFFNKFTTIPKVLKELQNQFVNVKREELEKELAWYVQESVLHHTVSASGTHTYQLRADAKDRVRKVVKEPSG